MVVEANNNDKNEDTAVNGAAGGAGDGVDVPTDTTEAGVTEGTYDAHEARKRKNTKQQKIDDFQEKVLEVLKSPVEITTPVTPPPPAEPKAYVDLAFAALIQKMKSNLSETEIMDTVKELEQVIHRVCREKRRRLEFQPNIGTTPMYQQLQPIPQGTKSRNILCGCTDVLCSLDEESKWHHIHLFQVRCLRVLQLLEPCV